MFLVTGGTGFLGSHLVPLLIESGAKVRILARNPPKTSVPNIEYVQGSILDFDSVKQAAQGCKGIFHLAAVVIHTRQPASAKLVHESAILGTLNVMKAAKEVGNCRVVYASTSGTVGCGRSPTVIANDQSPYCLRIVQHWPYYCAKIEAEIKAKQFARKNSVDLIIMRPTMMFGPGDTLFRSTHLILSFMERKIPIVAQGGLSFVDVRDVAKAFKAAMEIGKPGSSYLLGSINISLEDLFKTLEELTQVPRPTQRLPYYAAWLAVSAVDKFNRRVRGQWNSGFDPVRIEMASHFWFISSEKAEKELGFSPTDPTKTLQDTITWIIQKKINWVKNTELVLVLKTVPLVRCSMTKLNQKMV